MLPSLFYPQDIVSMLTGLIGFIWLVGCIDWLICTTLLAQAFTSGETASWLVAMVYWLIQATYDENSTVKDESLA